MNRSSALAEAIKDILNAADYSLDFTAIRSYRAFYTLKDLKTLKVTVIAPAVEQAILARNSNTDIISVDIVIQRQVDPTNTDAIDTLADLVEEIAESFRGTRRKAWIWLGTKITTPYDMEDLSEWRCFTSVIQLQYQIAWVK